MPNSWKYKKHHTEESKKRISESNKGKIIPESQKEILSKVHTGNKYWVGRHHTEETKHKLSMIHKNRIWPTERNRKVSLGMIGRNVSQITRQKIGKSNKGKIRTAETISKLKSNHRGMTGRKHSEETKRKISQAETGKNVSKETRMKYSINRSKQIIPYHDSGIEKIIQNELDKHGITYIKHKNFKIRDSYHQIDIFIEPNICIECDGDYWHSCLKQILRDNVIDIELEKQDMKVIRLWEYDIHNNLEWCKKQIFHGLGKRYFTSEIIKREKDYLAGGGKFIIPLPEFSIH